MMEQQIAQARKMELTSMLIVALEKIEWSNKVHKEKLEEHLFNLIEDAYNSTVNSETPDSVDVEIVNKPKDDNPNNEQQIIS